MKNIQVSERIAKVIARGSKFSRRDAEKLIADGRVKIDNQIILQPNVNVTSSNNIKLDNKSINFKPELDTKWILFEHEGALFNGRFLSAGSDTIEYNGENIVCDHFRLDIKKNSEEESFLDETDRLMSYSIKEKTIRQIWVERNGNRRIIKANILANGFPFQVDIQND